MSKQYTCPDISLTDTGLGRGFSICISEGSEGILMRALGGDLLDLRPAPQKSQDNTSSHGQPDPGLHSVLPTEDKALGKLLILPSHSELLERHESNVLMGLP